MERVYPAAACRQGEATEGWQAPGPRQLLGRAPLPHGAATAGLAEERLRSMEALRRQEVVLRLYNELRPYRALGNEPLRPPRKASREPIRLAINP